MTTHNSYTVTTHVKIGIRGGRLRRNSVIELANYVNVKIKIGKGRNLLRMELANYVPALRWN